MPGGDLEAGKSFGHRNEIVFAGHTGFARLAIEEGVPIVPIVVSGAGDTLLVLSDGQGLARRLRLPSVVRMKTLPVMCRSRGVSASVPPGCSSPTCPCRRRCAPPCWTRSFPRPAKMPRALARRVETVMSDKLTSMTEGRVPVLGMRWDELLGGRP